MSSKNDPILCAAATMDWGQVVFNGGPPCFHLEPGEIRFCGRAERWAGHDHKDGRVLDHEFVSLRNLLEAVERNGATRRRNAGELAQLRRIDQAARVFMDAMTKRGRFRSCNVEFDDLADALYDGRPQPSAT